MTQLMSEQLVEENPILAAARANSSVAPATPATPAPVIKGRTESSSTSTSTSVSKRVVGENKEGISTDSVINDITVGIAEADRLSRDRQAHLRQAANQQTAAQKAAISEGTNKAIIAKQIDTANIDADIKTREAWKSRGGVEEYSRLAGKKKEAALDLEAKQAKVSRLRNNDFMDNPLMWVVETIYSLPAAKTELRAAQDTFDTIDNVQDQMASFATQTEKAMDAVRTLDTQATLAAHGRELEAAATIKSAQYGAEAARNNAEAVQEARNMNQEQTNSQIQKLSLLYQRVNTRSTLAARKLLADKADRDRRVKETLIDGIIAGNIITGRKVYKGDDPELKQQERNRIEADLDVGGDRRERALVQFDYGVGNAKPTIYQTLNRLTYWGDEALRDGSNPAVEMIQGTWDQVLHASQGSPTPDGQLTTKPFKLTGETAANMVEELGLTNYAQAAAVIEEGDTKNPNHAIPMSALIEFPDIRDRLPVDNVLKPLLTGDTKDMTASQVFQLVTSGIKTKDNPEGTYTFSDGMETLQAIFSKAANENNHAQNRQLYNIPPQTNYNAQVDVKSALKGEEGIGGVEVAALTQAFGGGKGVINMMDETILTNAMLKYLSSKSTAEFGALAKEAEGGLFGFGGSIEGKPSATQEILDKINDKEFK